MPTKPGISKWSPIQILTRPDQNDFRGNFLEILLRPNN